MNSETRKLSPSEFLVDRDKTGRFIVRSYKSGKTYFVEPIGDPHTAWGDLNPATKKVEGSYGEKCPGSVQEKDSLITPDNGFVNIRYSGVGVSPFDVIEELDRIHLANR